MDRERLRRWERRLRSRLYHTIVRVGRDPDHLPNEDAHPNAPVLKRVMWELHSLPVLGRLLWAWWTPRATDGWDYYDCMAFAIEEVDMCPP